MLVIPFVQHLVWYYRLEAEKLESIVQRLDYQVAYKWLCELRTCIFAVSLRSSSSLESKGSSIEMLCGNAIWPKEGGGFVNGNGGKTPDPSYLVSKPWRPLTRKLKIPSAVISPYRTPQKNGRNELLKRVVAGGGAFKRPGWHKSSSSRSKPKRHSFDYVLYRL
ncbi:hypothetical protein DCAR_0311787 [Daucus carota subsp. sativus]|uniref:Uncharacterized protein n=1 Tax=Daucus carota subsp. sativus TaxID=79200 RepID=A0A162AIY7_DAUCS|nr:hypothetical protein DCAR_0311787 [Daucus carota subsp. sativus]